MFEFCVWRAYVEARLFTCIWSSVIYDDSLIYLIYFLHPCIHSWMKYWTCMICICRIRIQVSLCSLKIILNKRHHTWCWWEQREVEMMMPGREALRNFIHAINCPLRFFWNKGKWRRTFIVATYTTVQFFSVYRRSSQVCSQSIYIHCKNNISVSGDIHVNTFVRSTHRTRRTMDLLCYFLADVLWDDHAAPRLLPSNSLGACAAMVWAASRKASGLDPVCVT